MQRPRIEGGKDDDPHDPGGRTNEGIEQREYDAWCRLHNTSSGDVWNASEPTLTEIYRVQYWNPYCDFMPKGVDLVFFDINVNQGQHFAVVSLQQALGIEADGHFGLVTAATVKDIKDPADVVRSMTAQRIHRYHGTAGFPRYGDGWLYRAADCQKIAEGMITS
ncbi:MAG TPA: glycosyl hydrolase 108 family protein [Candidatus Acidoferrum sp.]